MRRSRESSNTQYYRISLSAFETLAPEKGGDLLTGRISKADRLILFRLMNVSDAPV